MKRNKIFGFLAGALLMAPAATFAQQALRSGYFLEGYEYRHVMNPAFGPDRKGFVSFPFLGNINVGMSGNMGVSNFLYKTPDGGLTTFLNESVTASDFLGGINQNNRLAIDYNWSIFSLWDSPNSVVITPLASICVPMYRPLCLTNCLSS